MAKTPKPSAASKAAPEAAPEAISQAALETASTTETVVTAAAADATAAAAEPDAKPKAEKAPKNDYEVKSPVKRNGRIHDVGDRIIVSEAEVDDLRRAGVI